MIFFLFLLPLFAIFVVVAVIHFLKSNPEAMALVKSYQGRSLWFNNGIIDVDGKQVKVVYRPSSKNTPSRLEISLVGNFCAHAVFHRESGVDRFGKEIGLNQEIQLYDPSFDNDVYVECEDQPFINQMFSSAQAKEHLKTILRDFTSFHIVGNTCMMVKTPAEGVGRYADAMMPAMRGMVALASAIPVPVLGQTSATPMTDQAERMAKFFVVIATAIFVTGVIFIPWGLSAFEPLWPGKMFQSSLFISLPLAGVFGVYVFNALKGMSIALRSFALSAGLGFIGLIFFCWGGAMVVNGSQDVSIKNQHEVSVMGKHVTHSKNSTTYHIRVNAWVPGLRTYQFSVPYSSYERINTGDRCVITTGSGLFNFEWVASQVCGG